jgi:hypothetical protein
MFDPKPQGVNADHFNVFGSIALKKPFVCRHIVLAGLVREVP